jgi:hypothetical protein
MVDSEPGLPTVRATVKAIITEKLFFGQEPSVELIAILAVYFVQGILGLARLAVSFFLKDELGLGPAEVSALMGVVAIPWMIKPLYGFISDGLPMFGYRRRPYLILAGFLGVASWLAMGTVVHQAWSATLAIALGSLGVALSDVIVDSIVVERARGEGVGTAGSLQSLLGQFRRRGPNHGLFQWFAPATFQCPDDFSNYCRLPPDCLRGCLVD